MHRLFSCLALFVLFTFSIQAETFTVDPDGGGDFATIQAAINAAAEGDVIELVAGVYLGEGNRDLSFAGKNLTLKSQDGNAMTCTIDCEGTEGEPHYGIVFNNGENGSARLEAVTITGSWVESHGGAIDCDGGVAPCIVDCRIIGNYSDANGGGIDCYNGAMPNIQNCYFEDNDAGWGGGGMQIQGAAPIITDCVFFENHAYHGAAMYVYGGSADPVVTDCLFQNNIAVHSTGGVHCEHFASPTFINCTFTGNQSVSEASALTTSIASTVEVQGCTFWGNGAGSPNATITNGEECQMTLENTIIAGTLQGPAIASYPDGTATVSLSCCDLFENEGGDWTAEIVDQLGVDGNINLDPDFCDPGSGDFTLTNTSPCAPFTAPNDECDLIGAWPVGCGGTAVAPSSWGGMKSLFR